MNIHSQVENLNESIHSSFEYYQKYIEDNKFTKNFISNKQIKESKLQIPQENLLYFTSNELDIHTEQNIIQKIKMSRLNEQTMLFIDFNMTSKRLNFSLITQEIMKFIQFNQKHIQDVQNIIRVVQNQQKNFNFKVTEIIINFGIIDLHGSITKLWLDLSHQIQENDEGYQQLILKQQNLMLQALNTIKNFKNLKQIHLLANSIEARYGHCTKDQICKILVDTVFELLQSQQQLEKLGLQFPGFIFEDQDICKMIAPIFTNKNSQLKYLQYDLSYAAANNAMITNKFLEYFGKFIKTQTKLQTLKLSFRKWGLCRQGMYTLGYKDFGYLFQNLKQNCTQLKDLEIDLNDFEFSLICEDDLKIFTELIQYISNLKELEKIKLFLENIMVEKSCFKICDQALVRKLNLIQLQFQYDIAKIYTNFKINIEAYIRPQSTFQKYQLDVQLDKEKNILFLTTLQKYYKLRFRKEILQAITLENFQ